MNRTVNLFLLLILGSSFIFPAAAIRYAHAEGTTVITSQPNAKSFKCIDPTGKKLLCILVVTHAKEYSDLQRPWQSQIQMHLHYYQQKIYQ